jgi:hypothetical protein
MAEPVDDGQRDTDDERHDVPPEDDLFTRSSFRLVDWPQLRLVDTGTPYPVVEALWRGRPVHVVQVENIRRWSREWQVAVLRCTAGATADGGAARPGHAVTAQEVDLPDTFREAGLLSDTVPARALVIEHSSGIQIGQHNRQISMHRFRVQDVRISLDRAVQRELTRIKTIRGPGSSESIDIAAGGPVRVVLRSSQGVQIGDHNTQRNHFDHIVRRPSVDVGTLGSPADLDRLVDKLRDNQMASARRDLTTLVRDELRRDTDRLYDALPGEHNVRSTRVPTAVRDVTGGTYGPANVAVHRERIEVAPVDIAPLRDAVRRLDELAEQEDVARQDEAARLAELHVMRDLLSAHDDARRGELRSWPEPAENIAEPKPPEEPEIHGPGVFFGF